MNEGEENIGMLINKMLHGGVEYLCGTAGSLILACTVCGDEHFRDHRYFMNPSWHTCFCGHGRMVPIRIDELESRWFPFWESLGIEVVRDSED